ncbi:MAG: aldo/keto reductase [Allgaiera sp.]|jgi:aryl-alcohol dehydrogenase-like predicted oxidoreductase|nr:aldo/keto reductase [Allgaiera sp.]
MKFVQLGRTGLSVSEICLGSMTWGSQNTEAEGHAQLDMAVAAGVNFIDTAEMYPTNPVRTETVGGTEKIIGTWLAKRGKRDDLVIATKITGAGNPHIRDGAPITGANLQSCCEDSLRRLQTDVIDIYQLHWPNRGSYHFRKMWGYDASGQDRAETLAHMHEVLEAAARLIEAGKIRHLALSNETAWGVAQWLRLAEEQGLPRVASVQNEYSLLCRLWDTDMAELSVNEEIPLLSYSPLAAGLLTGKYAGDVTPEGSRRAQSPDLGGRITPYVFEAVSAYLGIAQHHGLDPVQMALAWQRTRPFPVIPIVGATSAKQLRNVLGAVEVSLSPEVLAEIDAAHRAHPLPF